MITSCIPKKPMKVCDSALESNNQKDCMLPLLYVACTDNAGDIYNYRFQLDSINNTIVLERYTYKSGTIYHRAFHLGYNTIEYVDDVKGKIKIALRDGLISSCTLLKTNTELRYSYDSLQHIQSIKTYNSEKELCREKRVCWNGNHIIQVLDSFAVQPERLNTKFQVNNKLERNHQFGMPELLVNVLGFTMDEIIFAQLGFYGKLPLAKDFTVDRVSNGYPDEVHLIENYMSSYSDDGLLIESSIKYTSLREEESRKNNWNIENVNIIPVIIQDTTDY